MSAIAGIVSLRGEPVALEDAAGALAALAHRGASSALWLRDGIALGARALHGKAVTVLHPATGVALVADARVDNRAELLAALQPAVDATASDEALVLHAYLAWGTGCARHILGDFAFVLRDPRTQTIVAARDPMGVRPFYYHLDARRFVFGSEIKSLHAVPGVPREVDEGELAAFLEWRHEDRGSTCYRGIRRLPAAHVMVVRADGRATLEEYWTPADVRELRLGSDVEYEEAFRETFLEAVGARMRGPARVGATLSGGLDSSAITCAARAFTSEGTPPLAAFSLIFPDLDAGTRRLIDERPYIEAVRDAGALEWHAVRGDRITPLTDLDRLLWHLDEPYFAPNLYLHCGMFAAAQASGVGVLLDGFDGDSVVSHGFGHVTGMLQRREWDAFDREVRAHAARRGMAAARVAEYIALPPLEALAARHRWIAWSDTAAELARRYGFSRRMLLRHGARAAAPAGLRAAWRAARGRRGDSGILRAEASRRHAAVHAAPPDVLAATDRDSQIAGLRQPLYQLTLEMADKAAHAFGIEPRYPFFDRRLIELCVGVPEDQRFRDGWGRSLFRRAMTGLLPAAVQWRADKGNLAPNFHLALRTADAPVVERGARHASQSPMLASLIDPPALERTHARWRTAASWRDHEADGFLLFRTTVLAEWLHGESRAPSGARATEGVGPARSQGLAPRPHERAVTLSP